ncbi:glycosyltransferase [Zobellia alginiliquefaciens]|uniref:glycosyltransferase n=1 Tax=Zobellia alginiliquefaciens TaxID=3032586 RepID=UPI0023E10B36|nr:glycosyltransferase [Zobellia alginiliquefaciens]
MINKKLIYDTAVTGHHSEYISHLIDYLSDFNTEGNEYFFVVSPKFPSLFPEIYEKGKNIFGVHWMPVQENEMKRIREGNTILASIRSMDIMNAYAKKIGADHVVPLDFHTIKYGAIFKRVSHNISSILFLQFYRLKRVTFKEKLEFYKRYYLTKWCIGNPSIQKIFVLNDQETVNYMNNEFHTDCFQMLPDPIPQLEPLDNFDIYEHYGIEPHRKIYLHIGALGERKGTDEVIDSAHHLTTQAQKDIAVLLVGKAGNLSQENLYNEKIGEVTIKTGVQMLWDNQFVPTKMMKSIFNQCHAVLLPYKNAEFSSGILGHAAAASKRVIATKAGLIEELVSRYNLGELLAVPDGGNLALKMTQMLGEDVGIEGQRRFVENHSPKMFAELILKL